MAKHKTSAKSLIIEDDEVREDGDDMNPFSFKELIRSKNQGDSDAKKYPMRKEAYGSTFLGEYTIPGPKSFDQDFQGHFYIDPAPFPQSLDNETKEWAGSYQPSAIEEAHEFRLCGTAAADSSTYSSLCTEEEEDTSLSVWQVDEELSPKAPQYRSAPVNYEGDDETSMAELSYKTKKSSTENGHRDQQKKRAVKAENIVSKLKQELHQLQGQVEGCRYENERLRARETAALNTMKHNAQVASEYLNKAALNAETSIKKLLTGAETLCLVSQLLQSIDNISEIHNEG
ncbi:endosome-associated-trafficking regulator 1-like isoform X3 [Oncorhynchus tshawytscha]|uniref:Endosome-associated-trafficking regulator 1 n=1 Tax=Oncorhynchus tshawytscha TaxID=74940 RepID=A0A8C8HC70_ONCTS|nr:endosome-associated-trafficking regulator 1-like isoform X3 [Oncorhynchus tshawytscha]